MTQRSAKLERLLQGEMGNYVFPFFWQHGEPEAVLREYMKAIYDANLRSVCIESRPHPDFAGKGWWHDMDIILDEARMRGMKVWILDDSHFPTGYCNGAVKAKPAARRRWFLTYRVLGELSAGEQGEWKAEEYERLDPFEQSEIENYFHMSYETFSDDMWLGTVAVRKGGKSGKDLLLLKEGSGRIRFAPADGEWRVYSLLLTRNRGPHRDYMNMLDEESCHTLIETVYEPHYEHYGKDFGGVIAGFFSDEPEIGNGHLYEMDRKIYEVSDQPWSAALQHALEKLWGGDYCRFLPLLWEKSFDEELTAKVRYAFMDQVTRCVEHAFSKQIGDWCAAHGVQYIGHLIEDNNQHARCGSSLGHYYRGLAGQHMAGIDDIGGQVLPQGEDLALVSHLGTPRDGAFYHFTLGRLASSAAAIDSRKNGQSMCEIFGNYGWMEGVRLEAYLADHFMVRGVNHYVPHAFSAKAFPDPDCPPHFYAHGHNPQYRHFSVLMQYMNRVCTLISDGFHESEVAVLYHGEAEWTGMTCMYVQEPARVLTEAQIGFDIIPSDVFTDAAYATRMENGLQVNRQRYRCLVIPETDYITKEVARAVVSLGKQGFPCIFLNAYPKGICSWMDAGEEDLLITSVRQAAEVWPVVSLEERMRKRRIPELLAEPSEKMLRSYRYHADPELLYLVNEGTEIYEGCLRLQEVHETCCRYDAWSNRLEAVEYHREGDEIRIHVRVESGKSWLLLLDAGDGNQHPAASSQNAVEPTACVGERKKTEKPGRERTVLLNTAWTRSVCESIAYPAFANEKKVILPDAAEQELPDFGGFLRYERMLEIAEETQQEGRAVPWEKMILEISEAGEAVQLFVNGTDCGIQIVSPFRYEVGRLLHHGSNQLIIEVATTLERRIPPKHRPQDWEPHNHIGLCGDVVLHIGDSDTIVAAKKDC